MNKKIFILISLLIISTSFIQDANALSPPPEFSCCIYLLSDEYESPENDLEKCEKYKLNQSKCEKILKNWEETASAWERQQSPFYLLLTSLLPFIIILVIFAIIMIINRIIKNVRKNKNKTKK